MAVAGASGIEGCELLPCRGDQIENPNIRERILGVRVVTPKDDDLLTGS
jgi:hypothetical protein